MKCAVAVVLTAMALLPAWAIEVSRSDRASLALDLDGVNRPVKKVIKLLQGMLDQLEKDDEEDQKVYKQLACWCTSNDKEKSDSISEAEARIKKLGNEIARRTAESARLTAEIEQLGKEKSENIDALDAATALREKQIKTFEGQEQELLQASSALKMAIEKLAKHHQKPEAKKEVFAKESFLQRESVSLEELRMVVQKHSTRLKKVLTPQADEILASYLQAPGFFGATPDFKRGYGAQSGEIFGVLQQMKETFDNDLSVTQEEEAQNQKAYEELKAAKEAEIAAATAAIEKKTVRRADEDAKCETAKQDKADTENSLSADQKFLAKLKEKCSMTDSEWEERQKTRKLEMQAVSEALSVLSEDNSHEVFTRTFNNNGVESNVQLLQESTAVWREQRERAAKVLANVAQRLQQPRLATLAVQVRLDAFTRVKKAIDDMVAELEKEKADEIKHKDFCVDEFDGNQLSTEKSERRKADLEAKIAELTTTIKELTAAIEQLKKEVAESQVELKKAGEMREAENKEFQATITDQQETIALLGRAQAALQRFYGKAAFAQQEPAGPAPPPGFKEYKKNDAAGGVMSMLQQIVEDAQALKKEALEAENAGMAAYEKLVADTKTVMEDKHNNIVNKEETRAKTETEKVETEQELRSTEKDLAKLAKTKDELHTACDFTVRNFDVRQKARDEEIAALKQAKQILSGANFQEFLQKGR